MRSRTFARTLAVSVLAATVSFAQQQNRSAAVINNTLPLTFEANQGQTSSQVKFLSRGKGYTAFLTAGSMVLSLRPSGGLKTNNSGTSAITTPAQFSASTTLQFRLLGAAKAPVVVGEDPQPGRINYFFGKDPTKWHTNVPTYAKVRYKNVYPGIDLVYYANHRQLEYDFEILPEANPAQIQFEIQGANQIDLDKEGNLVLKTSGVELHFQCPAIYQKSNSQRLPVDGGYVVTDSSHVAFRVAHYDSTKPLVIDPVLVYSTYLGGSGNDQPSGIAVDSAGSVYIAGYTDSPDFPLATLGSLPTGTDHVFIAKLDPSGSNLVYADYLGGGGPDYGSALVLDGANEVWVTGQTASSDFPVVKPYQASQPGYNNGFLTKISADGSSLLYSTYLGGNGWDQPYGVSLDSSGNIYVAGDTSSANFPVVNANQATVSPNQGGLYGLYGFLTKFSPDGSSLVYSTYLGGSSNVVQTCGQSACWPAPFSLIYGVAVDANGSAYVTGNTNTYNFPVTQGAYLTTDSAPLNTMIGFVSKFTSSGNLDYSTYFYGSSGASTEMAGIAVDSTGSAYVTGYAPSDGTFPITSTSICDPGVYLGGCGTAFVTKFDPTGTSLLYSTFLGLYNFAYPQAIALDGKNDAYVSCLTSGGSFEMANGIEPYAGGNDLLVAEIDPSATTELFATFLGGTGDEYPFGLTLDAQGSLYVAGQTLSSDFPVTSAGFQESPGGNSDAFVLKIEPQSAPAFSASSFLLQYPAQLAGQTGQPQTTLLRNMGSAPLTISSATVSGDFAETDDCGTSVPAAGSCTLSVTFTPTAAGPRTGSVLIQDDAAGSPHTINLTGTGLGVPAVTLTPTGLTFSNQLVGTSSSPQTITLSSSGTAGLNLSSLQVSGDFAQTNNCPATLAPGANCSVDITFIPSAIGSRSGALTITDNAAGSPQSVALSGTGSGSGVVALTPTTLTFPSTPMGVSSAAKTVMLTNDGNASLTISNIQIAGDYAQTNNCPGSLAAGSSCTFNVTFTPTVAGSRSGKLTISDNAAGTPQIVALSGPGSDFSLASSPLSAEVNAGATANYTLTVAAVGGAFANAIKLICSGAPAHSTCTISPASATPGSTSTKVSLMIATSSSSSAAEALPLFPGRQQRVYAMWLQLQGFGMFGILLAGSKRWKSPSRNKKYSALLALILLLAGLLVMSACAGGTGIAPQGGGTTPGTYSITVTGVSGSLQHSLPLTLIVQ